MLSEQVLEKTVRLLIRAAKPSKIILFGSYARGEAGDESDFDLLLILREVQDKRAAMVKFRDVVRPLRVPVDILVASENDVNEWGHLPGTVFYEALQDGRVVYEAY